MLEAEGLRAGYGPVEVLRGFSLRVAAGELVAVLGANGAGKTTLNLALSGILPLRAGVVRFDGAVLSGQGSAAAVAAGLVHVPEGRRVFPDMSVRENLVLGSYRRGRASRSATLARVLDLFPRLRERHGQLAGTLSGGEQQMLAIGRGLMAQPRLLILDEPSLGLSPRLVEEMFTLIGQLRAEGIAVLIVEQNVVQTLQVVDRAYVMEGGREVISGPAAALRDDPAVRRAYLGLPR